MAVCVKIGADSGKETAVFESTEDAGILVQRCDICSNIHILMYKKRENGTLPAVTIDIDDTFAESLVAQLILLLAPKWMDAAPSSASTH